jgi:ArsR family transcriptional regulator, nickel/cobalt-responsive transcriptional repressor
MPRPSEHSPVDRPFEPGEAGEIAEGMRAFAADSRVRLLFELRRGERSVEDLATATGLDANVVSQQLRVLRQLRFVAPRREGRRIIYRLYDHHVSGLLDAVRHHDEHARRGWVAAEPANEAGATR